ncbi:MAG: gliding motility-associated C-terminal domain-containing protein [Schleiferiaceae bacterium]|nr:gliding motility-associated C-terminal domain-containing protein [Schleiferiaceae bacterium]
MLLKQCVYKWILQLLLLGFLTLPIGLQALDYYWVGGSGNWANINHWGVASGSTAVLHNTTPTSSDNVFIDANSLTGPSDTITLNGVTAFCHNITVINLSSQLYINISGNAILRVFGDVDLDFFQFMGNGLVSLESAIPGKTIRTSGAEFVTLRMNSISGAWTLQDTIKANHFDMHNGSFTSGPNYIEATNFTSQNGTLDLTGATIVANTMTLANANLIITNTHFTISHVGIFEATNTITGSGTQVLCTGVRFLDRTNQAHSYSSILFDSQNWGDSSVFFGTTQLTAHHVKFTKNGLLMGSWRADTLELQKGMTYRVWQNAIIRVLHLFANGDCSNWINIESTSRQSNAVFNMLGANANAYIRFRNISRIGSVWNVSPHLNAGQVVGISGSQDLGKKMYWIGGAGTWRNPAHWSLTDGGVPANCIPNPLDSVYFTNNSGVGNFSINLGDSVIQFHSLYATQNTFQINFTGTALPIQAYGDFILNNQTVWQVNKPIAFYGTAVNYQIQSSSNTIVQLSFVGGGTWTLLDSLHANEISVLNGHLEATNGYINTGMLVDFKNEWSFFGGVHNVITSTDQGELSIANATVHVRNGIQLDQVSFQLNAFNSLVRCAEGIAMQTANPQMQWHVVHWFSAGGTANFHNAQKRIRHLIINSDFRSSSDIIADTLTLTAGKTYELNNNITFFKIESNGTCNEPIIIKPFLVAQTHFNGSNNFHQLFYVVLQNIHFANGILLAQYSIDLGGNNGISFFSGASRTLYWVGGTGVWEDASHWAATSGGVGGECIPTPADSVVFDNNSATGNMILRINQTAFARDFMMFNTAFRIQILNGLTIQPSSHIQIFGNVHLSAELLYSYTRDMILMPDSGNYIYKSNNSAIGKLVKRNGGTYDLEDTLKLSMFSQYGGTILGNSNSVNVQEFRIFSGSFRNNSVFMKFSRVISHGTFEFPYCELEINYRATITNQIDATESEMIFTANNAELFCSSQDTISRILFTHPTGQPSITLQSSHVNYLHFYGWGTVGGVLRADTVVCTSGKSYFFQQGPNHIIYELFDVMGDYCNPILLRSRQQGRRANIYAHDTVNGDFLEIRDIDFRGPAPFYTGLHSADQGNNLGFIWDNKPGYIFGLGQNRYVLRCDSTDATSIAIHTNNFQGANAFLWFDGGTQTVKTIDQSQLIWVTADYISCTVTDSILVHFETVNHGFSDTTIICEPRMVTITPLDLAVAAEYQFLWSSGDTLPQTSFFIATDTMIFFEISDRFGNVCRDTLYFFMLDIPPINKVLSLLNCEREELAPLLESYLGLFGYDSLFFDWTGYDSIQHHFDGFLRYSVYYFECVVTDSLLFLYDSPFPIHPAEPTFCENAEIVFSGTKHIDDFDYSWSTGDNTPTTTVKMSQPGFVTLSVTDDFNRSCSDSLYYTIGQTVAVETAPSYLFGIQSFDVYALGDAPQATQTFWVFQQDTVSFTDTLRYRLIQAGLFEFYYYGLDPTTGCEAIDTLYVEVSETSPAWVPNAFTPNGDGVNDFWEFQIAEFVRGPVEIHVLNRWGNLVYQTEQRSIKWDGTRNGAYLPMDVYTYVIRLGDKRFPVLIHGTVSLLR